MNLYELDNLIAIQQNYMKNNKLKTYMFYIERVEVKK
jgi:hypothetical protein